MKTGGLHTVINQTRDESFKTDAEASDAEVLGVAIAKHFRWDAEQILEVAASALEDANYHTEADQIRSRLQPISVHREGGGLGQGLGRPHAG